jgi:hypothetical protein
MRERVSLISRSTAVKEKYMDAQWKILLSIGLAVIAWALIKIIVGA